MNIVIALFAHAVAGSISFPSSLNDAGIPTINCTFVNRDGSTLAAVSMQLVFASTTQFYYPESYMGDAYCESLNHDFQLQLRDDLQILYYERFESFSHLAIGRHSWIRQRYETITYTGNHVILNQSRDEFENTVCINESLIRIPILANRDSQLWEDEFYGSIGTSNDSLPYSQELRFSFWPAPTRAGVVSLPTEYIDEIFNTLSRLGAVRTSYSNNRQGWILSNCNLEFLAHLPEIYIWLLDGSVVVLSPEDYVDHQAERNMCVLLVRRPDSFGHYYFNPLLIKGLNFQISQNYLDICDSSNQ